MHFWPTHPWENTGSKWVREIQSWHASLRKPSPAIAYSAPFLSQNLVRGESVGRKGCRRSRETGLRAEPNSISKPAGGLDTPTSGASLHGDLQLHTLIPEGKSRPNLLEMKIWRLKDCLHGYFFHPVPCIQNTLMAKIQLQNVSLHRVVLAPCSCSSICSGHEESDVRKQKKREPEGRDA